MSERRALLGLRLIVEMSARYSVVILLGVATTSCFIHPSRNRVSDSNRTVISFLTEYSRVQLKEFALTNRYNSQLTPDGAAGDWLALAQDYARVTEHEYSCRFDVYPARFSVTCVPEWNSGLRISFYVDESCVVRLTADGLAGPSSPAVVRLPGSVR